MLRYRTSPIWLNRLIAGEKIVSCVPDCWQETALQVDYAVALTLAVMGGTLPARVAKELTGLLHDMVWLLAEFVKEPYIRALRRVMEGRNSAAADGGAFRQIPSLFLVIACGTPSDTLAALKG
jgi:hypothetical protein